MAEGGRTGGSSMSLAKWVPYVRPEREGREGETVLGRAGGGGVLWRRESLGDRGSGKGWWARKMAFLFFFFFLFSFLSFSISLSGFLKLLRLVGTFPFSFSSLKDGGGRSERDASIS